MLLADILLEIRRNIGDVAGLLLAANADPVDAVLKEYVRSIIFDLENSDIVTVTYTVTTDIAPEPALDDSLLIAVGAASRYLTSDLLAKVRKGEVGFRFRSGQDEISLIEASRQLTHAAEKAERNFRRLVLLKIGSKTLGAERLQ